MATCWCSACIPCLTPLPGAWQLQLTYRLVLADEVDSLLGVRKDMDHEATIAVRNEFMQACTASVC